MRIAINLVGDENWFGGVVYIRNLLQALNLLPAGERKKFKLILVVSPKQKAVQELVVSLADEVYCSSIFYRASKRLPLWLRSNFLSLFNPTQCDIMFPVLEPYAYPFSYCGWIPDFQHDYLPHLYTDGELEKVKSKYSKVSTAPLVVLSSDMALSDFKRIYPQQANRGKVLKFASYSEPSYFEGDPLQVQSKYNLPANFFLVSNQFWAHKNHKLLVEAVSVLKNKGIRPCIVCTGKKEDYRNPNYFSKIEALIKQKDVVENFRILGMIPRDDQMMLMRRALAVIQPSLFEGWSTVLEDAKSLGKPLIVSDFPVHIEQVGKKMWVFPRDDAERLAVCMQEAIDLLNPGPNFIEEEKAREKNLKEMQAFGRNFLAIANECLAWRIGS